MNYPSWRGQRTKTGLGVSCKWEAKSPHSLLLVSVMYAAVSWRSCQWRWAGGEMIGDRWDRRCKREGSWFPSCVTRSLRIMTTPCGLQGSLETLLTSPVCHNSQCHPLHTRQIQICCLAVTLRYPLSLDRRCAVIKSSQDPRYVLISLLCQTTLH